MSTPRFTQRELWALIDVADAADAAGTQHESYDIVLTEHGEEAAAQWSADLQSALKKLSQRIRGKR